MREFLFICSFLFGLGLVSTLLVFLESKREVDLSVIADIENVQFQTVIPATIHFVDKNSVRILTHDQSFLEIDRSAISRLIVMDETKLRHRASTLETFKDSMESVEVRVIESTPIGSSVRATILENQTTKIRTVSFNIR